MLKKLVLIATLAAPFITVQTAHAAPSPLADMGFNEVWSHATAISHGYSNAAPDYTLMLTDVPDPDHHGRYCVMLMAGGNLQYGTADSRTGGTDFFIQWEDGSVGVEPGRNNHGTFAITPLGRKVADAGGR
jgi:hypothetical protein